MSIDRVIALDELYQSYVGFTKIPTYGTNRRCKTCHQLINPYKPGTYCFCHQGEGSVKKEQKQQEAIDANVRKNNYRRYARIKNKRILEKLLTKV